MNWFWKYFRYYLTKDVFQGIYQKHFVSFVNLQLLINLIDCLSFIVVFQKGLFHSLWLFYTKKLFLTKRLHDCLYSIFTRKFRGSFFFCVEVFFWHMIIYQVFQSNLIQIIFPKVYGFKHSWIILQIFLVLSTYFYLIIVIYLHTFIWFQVVIY